VPPDVQVAAGPNYVMELVNDLASIYIKNGTLVSTLPLTTLFNSGGAFSDPKVLYDASSNRWFISVIDGLIKGVDFGISVNNDPLVWNNYQIHDPVGFSDQPIIGVSDDKFVISVNDFNGNTLIGAHYWVFNKAEMVAGLAAIDFASFGPFGTLESIHPVQSLSPTTTEYMVSTLGEDLTAITPTEWLFAISGVPPGSLSVVNATLPVSQILHPTNGVQKASTIQVNTDDQRVEDALWYNGKIWSASNDQCIPSGDTASRSCFRLTEIDTSTTSLLQDFDVGGAGKYYFYPALRVDSIGDLAVIYGYSSANDYPSLALTGQALQDSPTSLSASVILKHGLAPESSGFLRYGDYFGAGVDPSNPSQVWVAGEYVSTTGGVWSTYIASMKVIAFSVSASPASVDIAAGNSATATIGVSSIGGFSGTASLAATASPSGLTLSLNPNSVAIPSGGTVSSTLTISSSGTTAPGLYNLTVTVTSGTVSYSRSVQVRVGANFSIASSLSSISIQVRTTSTATITVTSLNGFAGTVSFSETSLPQGPGMSMSPGSVALSAGGTATATLSITAPAQAATYVITVQATTGSVSHSVPITLNSKDFQISAVSTIPLQAGATKTSTITLVSLNGYGGNVTVTGLVSPSGPSVSENPSSVSLAPFGFSASTMTVSTTSGVSAGNYTIFLTASASGLSHRFNVQLRVMAYAVNGNPTLAIPGGSSTSETVTVTSLNGFSGNVTLTASPSPQVSAVTLALNPTLVTLTAGGSATSTLTVTATSSAPRGLYVLSVVGTSGPTQRTNPITLAVTPVVININSQSVFTGAQVTTSGSLSIDSPLSTFTASGTASVVAKNATTGTILFSKTYSIARLPFHDMTPGTVNWAFLLNIALNLRLGSIVDLTATGNSTSSTVTVLRNLDINANGIVDLADFTIAQQAFDCTIGQSCYNPAADIDANGRVDISDVATMAANYLETDFLPNYNLALASSPLTLIVGTSGNTTLTLASVNGFSGTVSLAQTSSPSGISVSLSQTSLPLGVNGTATTTIMVSTANAQPGTYAVNITATSGILAHWMILTVNVADFSMTFSQIELVVPAGPVSGVLTFTSLGSFAGTITLSTRITPITGAPTVHIGSTSVTLTAGGTAIVGLGVGGGRNGSYNLTVTATSGIITHQIVIPVGVCLSGCV